MAELLQPTQGHRFLNFFNCIVCFLNFLIYLYGMLLLMLGSFLKSPILLPPSWLQFHILIFTVNKKNTTYMYTMFYFYSYSYFMGQLYFPTDYHTERDKGIWGIGIWDIGIELFHLGNILLTQKGNKIKCTQRKKEEPMRAHVILIIHLAFVHTMLLTNNKTIKSE